MLCDVRGGHVVHLLHHLVNGAIGDYHHSSTVLRHREVGQKFSDELNLIVEVLCSNRSAGINEEDKIRFKA